MAVNPKLILIASELAGNEKVRKTLLYVLFFSLGLIMLIFVVFIGLISGLLSIAQDNDLRNHWNYYRTSISEIFSSIEGEINSDVKSEVYDFMPEFSVNLSKATMGIFSLDLSKTLVLRIHSTDENVIADLTSNIQQFIVK